MLRWVDVLKYASQGNPEPDQKIHKTDQEWQKLLTDEQFRITRLKETERPFSSEMCSLFEPGLYACVCCGTLLFDADEKFESGSGWPSFTQPFNINSVAYQSDHSFGMRRIETTCNACDAHLGHVFPDGPEPSGLRYCINALALTKVESELQKATLGGGCFWCTEALFQQLNGVVSVLSGYSGGQVVNPSYREVSTGTTGHAEVIQITYDPNRISYQELIRIHLSSHDPTTLNQQGADIGSQYRSIILYHNEEQREMAQKIVSEMQSNFDDPIVTEIQPFSAFFQAEDKHQKYYQENSQLDYCQIVIDPKLKKLRAEFNDHVKD